MISENPIGYFLPGHPDPFEKVRVAPKTRETSLDEESTMSEELAGLTAVVTGAGSGIGLATAQSFSAAGARVFGLDINVGAMGGAAEWIPCDIGSTDSVTSAFATLLAQVDTLDILVNNAGIGAFGATETTTETDFDAMYATNVKVPYFLVATLAPAMAERGQGVIVNLTTMVAEFGLAGAALYGSSKAAVVLLTKAWAAEFGPHGVRVNAVSPGPTRTEGTAAMGEGLDQIASQAPAARVADPQEIAQAVAYLAGDDASFVHGTVLHIDGGRSAV
jgi:NAD(P)-dependent dehydrogenase (short-subunit alcohol dehydrogenase family)